MEKYWKVKKYTFDEKYSKRYPYLAEVELKTGEVFTWRLPDLSEEVYDLDTAEVRSPEGFWK
jgi:hypothetical protein